MKNLILGKQTADIPVLYTGDERAEQKLSVIKRDKEIKICLLRSIEGHYRKIVVDIGSDTETVECFKIYHSIHCFYEKTLREGYDVTVFDSFEKAMRFALNLKDSR